RDHIRAVIRGTAIGHDGRSSSLTAPNARAQEAVIRAALDDAGVSAEDVDYLEAHGAGTPVGDPIEVEAATSAFAGRSRPLVIGCAKTNLGHLEAAAGVAGLAKVVLAIEHASIPPNLHLRTLSPLLQPYAHAFVVPRSLEPWPDSSGRPRLASVTSMGLSGTNVHVVLEQAPTPPASSRSDRAAPPPTTRRDAQLLCVSARSESALRESMRRFADHLQDA